MLTNVTVFNLTLTPTKLCVIKGTMLLAIDIGNTTVSLGILKGRRVVQIYTTETTISQTRLRSELKRLLGRIKKKFPQIRDVILCSVVPKALSVIKRAVISQLKIKPKVVGRDIKVPLKNNYRNPRQVGQDRLICAYAAKHLYGLPAIIVDFGTATTFDVIAKHGSYEGGIIVPGIRLSVESLYKKTALLPKINSIKGPKALIGKDTQESILSGIFFGYGSMCCGLIDRIAKRLKGKPKVIVTGGHTHLMRKFIVKKITTIDNGLVFKGMALLWRQSQ